MSKKKDAIVMALINQIESDLHKQMYEPIDEMLTMLLKKKANKKILFGYLSDENIEQLHEGKLDFKY